MDSSATSKTEDRCPTIRAIDTLAIVKAFNSARMDVWADDFLPRFGDHFFIPLLNFYVLNRPSLIYELLVKQDDNSSKGKYLTENLTGTFSKGLLSNEGEDWAFTRRLLTKEFSKSSISRNRNGISHIAGQHMTAWREAADSPLDLTRAAFKLAFDTISIFLFKRRCELHFDTVHNALGAMRDAAQLRVLGPLRHLPLWLPLPIFVKARKARKRMHELVRELAEDYKLDREQDQALTKLLANEVLKKVCHEVQAGNKCPEWADGELVILYAAGHETTAMGISWMCYAVANHPELQDRLYQESKDLNLDNVEDPAVWANLDLHQRVVNESLRFYPPVPGYGRSYSHDVQLSETLIPKGATIAIMPYVVHRNPEFWENPGKFDPDRFSPENVEKIKPGSFVPFGIGPRKCIGAEMASTQMAIVLAHILRNFKIKVHNKNPIDLLNAFTSQPSEKIELELSVR